MATPWWLKSVYEPGVSEDNGSGGGAGITRLVDARTNAPVFLSDGKYYYGSEQDRIYREYLNGTSDEYPLRSFAPIPDESPKKVTWLTDAAKGILAPYGNLGGEVGLVDGKATYLYPTERGATIYGDIGTYGGAQRATWTSPSGAKGTVVQGPDGAMWVQPPADARYGESDTADHSTMIGDVIKTYGPLAMAALPFTGVGSALTGALGDIGGRAVLNAGTSLLTGGDPIRGALSGAVGGAIGGADIPAGIKPLLSTAASTAINGGSPQSAAMSLLGQGVKAFSGMGSSLQDSPQQSPQDSPQQSTDPAQIWPTQQPLFDLNQDPANSYLNAPVSGAPQMDMTGFMTPQSYDPSQIWPTTNEYSMWSPDNTAAGNYMDNGAAFGGSPAPSVDSSGGSTIQNFIKGLLGSGASAGGGAPSAGMLGGLLSGSNSSLLLPLLGGLLGGMSGGSKPAGTTTTVNDIPDWQKPYVTNAFGQAGNALNDANAAYAATKPTTDLATNNLNATIRGDFLGSNPALDGMFKTASDAVANKVNSAFSSAGRYGSGAQTSTLTEGLGNLANNIYGQNYQQERQRQFAGSLAAPSYSQGTTQAAYGPANGYANIVRQPVGSTQSSPYFTNPLGGAVSGLLGGYALSRA